MVDFPIIKELGKKVNKSPQGDLDPNDQKKNHPYGMGTRRITNLNSL